MEVIRDENAPELMIIPLLHEWGLDTTCHVRGCEGRSSAIVITDARQIFAICEEHYGQLNSPEGLHATVDNAIVP